MLVPAEGRIEVERTLIAIRLDYFGACNSFDIKHVKYVTMDLFPGIINSTWLL